MGHVNVRTGMNIGASPMQAKRDIGVQGSLPPEPDKPRTGAAGLDWLLGAVQGRRTPEESAMKGIRS